MNATEELRRLLDERGVEWEDHSGSIERRTVYMTSHGWAYVSTINDRYMLVEYHDMQPEQAIDATLGRGTTTRTGKYRTKYGRRIPVCERCGYGIGDMRWNFCPSCGAEVVDE